MAENLHAGHRARMRDKFLRFGAAPFATYELLEMLLYYTVPVRDTNPIAKSLLSRFGEIEDVFRASRAELLSVPDVGAATADLLLAVGRLAELPLLYSRAEAVSRSLSGRDTGAFLIDYFAGRKENAVVMLSFDNRMRLIALDEMFTTDYAYVAVKPRDLAAMAIRRKASSVIIAHNHPDGLPCFSEGDRATDRMVRQCMRAAGVIYPMHYIVAGKNIAGYPGEKNTFFAVDDGEAPPRPPFEEREATEPIRRFLRGLFAVPFPDEADALAEKLAGCCRFPSHIFEPPPEDLVRATGIGLPAALYLRLSLEIYIRRITDRFRFGRSHLQKEITDYLCALLLGKEEENVVMLSVNEQGNVVACDTVSVGSVNAAQILPRRVVGTCERRRVRAIILAHNHPSGSAAFSREDEETTRDLIAILSEFGIRVLAHYTVSGFLFTEVIGSSREGFRPIGE